GTPPAFVLSQDQTLNKSLVHSELNRWLENRSRNTRLVFKDQSLLAFPSLPEATLFRLSHQKFIVNPPVSIFSRGDRSNLTTPASRPQPRPSNKSKQNTAAPLAHPTQPPPFPRSLPYTLLPRLTLSQIPIIRKRLSLKQSDKLLFCQN
ncbi:hypothetical protein OS242_19400, partial [Tumebacillus sp. DT12]